MSLEVPATTRPTVLADRSDSDPLFRALVEQSWECIALLDAEGTVLFINPAVERILGWTPEESWGDNAFAYVHPEDLPDFQASFADLLQHPGETRTSDFRGRNKEGDWRWLSACATNLLEDPRAASVVCNIRDVTEERNAAEALRKSENHYRALIEQATEGIWVTRVADGVCLEANPAAAKMLGYSVEELVGMSLNELTHPDDRWERAGTMRKLAETGTATAVRRLRKKGGEYLVAEGAARLLEGDRCLVCFRDITARREAEERERFLLSAGEELSRSLHYRETLERVARLTIPRLADYCLIDIVGEDAGGNQSVERMVIAHRDPADEAVLREIQRRWPVNASSPSAAGRIIRKPETELIREVTYDGVARYSVNEEHLAMIRSLNIRTHIAVPLVARGQVFGVISMARTGDANLYDEEDVRMAEELARRAALAIDNARLYSDLQQRVRELAEADRQKDEFLATLSHELRNPLSPILHSTQILQASVGDEPEIQRLTEVIQRHTRHMARLVDDLLDMSRITHGTIELRREEIDLCECIRATLDGVRNVIEERQHTLTIELPQESVLVHADSARLCQVAGNLLSNAARYTPSGGRIEVELRPGDNDVEVVVRDNGEGMSPEFVERAFEMFAQEKSSKERAESGLGIGLTLVKRLVELHGGSVRVESAGQGLGSTFTVTLPLAQAAAQPRAVPVAAASPAENGTGDGRRILVVDDNEDVALSLAELLSLLGHTVRVAHDGERALALAQEEAPEIAFIDIGMPGMDGYEVARRFRRHSGLDGCRLIALTGFGRADDRLQALEAGFDVHQTKPVDLDRLYSLLAEPAEA